jgi:hypothetical protein
VSKKKVSCANRAIVYPISHALQMQSSWFGFPRASAAQSHFSENLARNYRCLPHSNLPAVHIATSSDSGDVLRPMGACPMVGGDSAPLRHFDLAVKLRTSGRSKCTWDGCEQTSPGDEELRAHLDDHSSDALAHWTLGSKCTWQGCKSKAVFKALSLFKHHLLNIHTNPLLCTQPRCSYKKPFKNKHELERHNSTQHSVERRWECPYDSCPSESRTFARKDKWLKHIRETQHENDAFCPFYHCSLIAARSGKSFESRKEIGEHFSDYHAGRAVDGYGCGLGSCENSGRRDRWDLFGLWEHLCEQHNIYHSTIDLENELTTDHIYRLQHVPSRNLNKWVHCKICASQTGYQTPLDATTSSFPSSPTASF